MEQFGRDLWWGIFEKPFLLILGSFFAIFFVTVGCIYYLRKRHPHEVYAIWLVISFFFITFFGIGIAAQQNKIGIAEVCGSYAHGCEQVFDMLTNIRDELKLVSIFTALTVIPQILAYLLSALSGSAPHVT